MAHATDSSCIKFSAWCLLLRWSVVTWCLSGNQLDKLFTASSANSLILCAAAPVLMLGNLGWLLLERENRSTDEDKRKYWRASYKNVHFILDDSNIPKELSFVMFICEAHHGHSNIQGRKHWWILYAWPVLNFQEGNLLLLMNIKLHLETVEWEKVSSLKAWLDKLQEVRMDDRLSLWVAILPKFHGTF